MIFILPKIINLGPDFWVARNQWRPLKKVMTSLLGVLRHKDIDTHTQTKYPHTKTHTPTENSHTQRKLNKQTSTHTPTQTHTPTHITLTQTHTPTQTQTSNTHPLTQTHTHFVTYRKYGPMKN